MHQLWLKFVKYLLSYGISSKSELTCHAHVIREFRDKEKEKTRNPVEYTYICLFLPASVSAAATVQRHGTTAMHSSRFACGKWRVFTDSQTKKRQR